ncbi:MAG: T9SS type A sorting domain-containing protein [Bacteroidota bacterium]
MKKYFISFLVSILTIHLCNKVFSQGPWGMPLQIAYSTNGITFTNNHVFQDSSGVPSITRDTNGILACAFQWFPAPVNGPHWDSVAVKFSYDNGYTWTNPTQCVFSGMPANYKRPFDPAIVCTDNGQYRLYFSCGPIGTMSLDTSVNTYSAVSDDGIHYNFEQGARFDDSLGPVIDPCIVKFNGIWHYSAPIGAPVEGAFHCTSLNGINFIKLSNIPSDSFHVWGGNMCDNGSDIRFYGSTTTSAICYSSTPDGNSWASYINTNVNGGDPAVYKVDTGSYIIIYVGPPYSGISETSLPGFTLYPNPTSGKISVATTENGSNTIEISNVFGKNIFSAPVFNQQLSNEIDLTGFPSGIYLVKIYVGRKIYTEKIVLQ